MKSYWNRLHRSTCPPCQRRSGAARRGACGWTWSWSGSAWWPAGSGTAPSCAIRSPVDDERPGDQRLAAGRVRGRPAARSRRRRRTRAAPRRTRPGWPRRPRRSARPAPAAPARPARARAIRARCCWPPERVTTGSPARSVSPTARQRRGDRPPVGPRRRAAACPGGPAGPRRPPRATVAGTPPPAPIRCGTYPMRHHCRNRRCGVSKRVTRPALSGTSPSTARTSVDLPEPLAPSTATTSPARPGTRRPRSTGRSS